MRLYDTSVRYEDLPVIARADHLFFTRKSAGLEHANLAAGKRQTWIGKIEKYDWHDVDRRTFKVFRDTDILKEINNIERRLRNVRGAWAFIQSEEQSSRVRKTMQLISRMTNVSNEFMFIPHISKQELDKRLADARMVCQVLLSKVR